MDQSSQNPNPAPNATANPVPDVPVPNTVVNKHKQIRLLIFVTLLFLTFVIAYTAITKQRWATKAPQSSVIPTAIPTAQQSNVSLKKEYKNPFDKNAQYVNPFSQYKNPFDSLK